MCDTLPTSTTTPKMSSLIEKYYIAKEKSITEPDTGCKSDSLINLDYKQESERLESFTNWTNEAVRPEDLAEAGFYFLHNHPSSNDLVKCAFCNAEICSWEAGDNPLDEHIKWAPSCPYAKEKYRIAKITRREAPNVLTAGRDVCGVGEMRLNSVPESETFRLLSSMVKNYEDVKVRLASFENWPRSTQQPPAVLAAAGFFYRGVEDHAICFTCGGALRDWRDEDDPWEQHALWFPRCRHLFVSKGPDYVGQIQRKFKDVPRTLTKEPEECKSESEEENSPSPVDDGILRCKICDSNERNVIFIPCKHILACDQCSKQFDNCPVCRKQIKEKMRVFLS